MKTLILMRHAKSSHDDLRLSDFERPLNERGKKDAPEMGKRMRKKGIIPDLIVSSPSKRTVKTSELLAEELDYSKKKIIHIAEIYEASQSDMMRVIHHLDDKCKTVIIIGHNPTFTSLIGYLTKSYIDNLPTSGFAKIDFKIETWIEVQQGKGILDFVDYPKSDS